MPAIHYFTEEIPFKLSNSYKTTRWLKSVITFEFRLLGNINFVFCNDAYLHKINVEYLNHDTFTDIITFDNSDDFSTIEGDIYISIERITDNARKFSRPFDEELHRVLVHGILHLVGYSDKTPLLKSHMRKKEDEYLSLR